MSRFFERREKKSWDEFYAIRRNLKQTRWLGLFPCGVATLGFSVICGCDCKLFFLLVLLSSATYISGFFLGFLFGLPKRNSEKETPYNLSNNLIDISDWLTKIIIGLGLVEIKSLSSYLNSVGEYIKESSGGEESVKVFAICCIIYYVVFGIYFGYNYTRLYLSSQLKIADDNLLELKEKEEKLDEKNFEPNEIDLTTKNDIQDYVQLLKVTKTEDQYNFNDWYYKGVAAYNNDKFAEAVVYLNNALIKAGDGSVNMPKMHLYLGLSYERLGKFKEGIKQYDCILNTYPNYDFTYGVYSNRGILFNKLERYNEALKDFDKSISLNENFAKPYAARAKALEKLKRLDEAYDSADKAIKLKPKDSFNWSVMGSVLYYMGKLDDSVQALKKCVEYNPENGSAWYNISCIYALKKDKHNLLYYLGRAIAIDSTYKNKAKEDKDFKDYYDDPDFKQLIS